MALTAQDFRRSPIFEDQPEEHLAWLAGCAEELIVEAGDSPFETGAEAAEMFVILEGALHVYTTNNGVRRLFDTVHAGAVTGLLPYSRMQRYEAEGVATERVRAASVPKTCFPEMLYRMPELGNRLVALMSDRVRESTRGQQQQEKLAALGKLSAGLAHELNNPAAAVQRSVSDLEERVARLPALVACLVERGVTPEQIRLAHKVRADLAGQAPGPLSALDRSELEDAIADRLEDFGVSEPWRFSEVLVESGFVPECLDELAEGVPDAVVPDLLAWIEGSLAADHLLREIASATGRITELVRAIKQYSHMDRAPEREPTDLAAGVESTLTMLSHELKRKHVHVRRRFEDGLPPVWGYPGELNQVWTNLLDNAIDAVDEGGTVTVGARREGRYVCAWVQDDGPGIPEDALPRIFEPFFTTKEVGAGTGLGLELVQRIVTQAHAGTVNVESGPEGTTFFVRLPAADEGAEAPAPAAEEPASAEAAV